MRSRSHVTVVDQVDPETGRFKGIGGNQSSRRADFRSSDFSFRRAPADRGELDWAEVDRSMGREITSRVEGSGKIDVDVRAPQGTKVSARGGGIFKRTSINRQAQMQPAQEGPKEDTSGETP